jgi:ribosomal-protein-alanine N-acetyltransferase
MNEKFINLLPLETERLIIKPTTEEDIELILKMDKQAQTQLFLGGIKNKTKEERIEFLKKKEEKFKNGIASSLTIQLKNDTKIGFIGLAINEEEKNAEISYIFDYEYCNNGYCTEACKKIIEIAFNILNMKCIIADTIEDNKSSQKVLEKLGFIYQDTTLKDSLKFNNYKKRNQ